jgi:hypothetical protein
MPSLFRISSYGWCAFTGTLSFLNGIWGVLLPHLYTGGKVTFLHPYTPESWADHIEVESVIHSGSPVPRSQVQELVDVIGERYIEVWG